MLCKMQEIYHQFLLDQKWQKVWAVYKLLVLGVRKNTPTTFLLICMCSVPIWKLSSGKFVIIRTHMMCISLHVRNRKNYPPCISEFGGWQMQIMSYFDLKISKHKNILADPIALQMHDALDVYYEIYWRLFISADMYLYNIQVSLLTRGSWILCHSYDSYPCTYLWKVKLNRNRNWKLVEYGKRVHIFARIGVENKAQQTKSTFRWWSVEFITILTF